MNELHSKIIDMFDNMGLGQTEIARRLGVTKNLVIGVVYRYCHRYNGPTSTTTQRLDALHEMMDKVLDQCPR